MSDKEREYEEIRTVIYNGSNANFKEQIFAIRRIIGGKE